MLLFANLGTAYLSFVSTFYATKEALGSAYKNPFIESFCDALIWEKDKLN
jgi:hypothetical protein